MFDTVKIEKVVRNTELAQKLLLFVDGCSWHEAKQHIAWMIREWVFKDWETMFVAIVDDEIAGMVSVMKTDYYPLTDIFPWISSVFVSEKYRGRRLSGQLISHANCYVKTLGFAKSYIPSNCFGLYENYGYYHIRDIENYGGGIDHLFAKDLT